MPVLKNHPDVRSNRQDLVQRLAQELNRDSTEPISGAPDIIEDYVPRSERFSVTVIWDDWQGVPSQERGKAILDAYQLSNRVGDLLKINATLGLTPPEAERFGVRLAEKTV